MQKLQREVAARRPVNLSLDRGLLAEARKLTPNLSATVEHLLGDFVTQERARRRADDAKLDQVIDALNEFHVEHGFLSDSFPSF